MERLTVRLPGAKHDALQELVDAGEFHNKSAAVRTAVHNLLEETEVIEVAISEGRVGDARCPECSSKQVHKKVPSSKGAPREHPEDYYCNGCDEHFDEPEWPVRRRRADA